MSQITMCVDGSSPEASVVCPDVQLDLIAPVARTRPIDIDVLPHTGVDVAALIGIALFLLCAGLGIWLWSQIGEDV